MLDKLRVPVIGEASGELFAKSEPAINLAQQQSATIAGEVSASEIGLNTPASKALKLEIELITLCRRLSRVHDAGFCLENQSLQLHRTDSSALRHEKCGLARLKSSSQLEQAAEIERWSKCISALGRWIDGKAEIFIHVDGSATHFGESGTVVVGKWVATGGGTLSITYSNGWQNLVKEENGKLIGTADHPNDKKSGFKIAFSRR